MSRPVTPKVAALIERGRQASQAGDFNEAARAFERALQQMPELTPVQAMRAESLQLLGRAEEAERAWRQVLRREPANLAALEGLTHLCMGAGRLAELEDFARRGCAAAPSAPGFCLSLGYALWWQGRHDDALAAYRRGAGLAEGNDAPFFHEAHLAQAMAFFRLGRWDEGWKHYALRVDRSALRARYPRLAPDPASLRSAAPMRLAVHSEQGIGDELFFLRFAPALRAKGHRLLLRTHPKLVPLLRPRTDLFDEVSAAGEPLGDCDAELQASDLALAGGEPFAPSLHLAPDPARREALERRLRAFGPGPYIGVTWRAGLNREEGKQWGKAYWTKEIAPGRLGELLRNVAGSLVIVQRKPAAEELAQFSAAAGRPALDLAEMNDDLLDAVALLSLFDEYVGVSNTNMHLLAGLESPKARVVLPVAPEWRWAMQGDSPWFPGFRLYRAQQHGSLEDALSELARDLHNSLAKKK
jgi:tetratricopeptide (TPR) repeat protein